MHFLRSAKVQEFFKHYDNTLNLKKPAMLFLLSMKYENSCILKQLTIKNFLHNRLKLTI